MCAHFLKGSQQMQFKFGIFQVKSSRLQSSQFGGVSDNVSAKYSIIFSDRRCSLAFRLTLHSMLGSNVECINRNQLVYVNEMHNTYSFSTLWHIKFLHKLQAFLFFLSSGKNHTDTQQFELVYYMICDAIWENLCSTSVHKQHSILFK